MTGIFVQRCEKFLHNFYPDNVEGEGVKKCEECLSKTTLNVFSFYLLPNDVYLHLNVYLLLKLKPTEKVTELALYQTFGIFSPLYFFKLKRAVWRGSLQEQLQLYQVEEAKGKSAQPLKYVLEINRSDFYPSTFKRPDEFSSVFSQCNEICMAYLTP